MRASTRERESTEAISKRASQKRELLPVVGQVSAGVSTVPRTIFR